MTPNWQPDATKVLTRSEIGSVLQALKGKLTLRAHQNRIIFRLATCCGLRVSEIRQLRLADVRVGLDRPHIVIRRTVSKSGRARSVPLWWDIDTLKDIEAWKAIRQKQGAGEGSPFICALREDLFGKALHRTSIRRRFRTACSVLGKNRLKGLTIHHGRHSFCSHALAGGKSLAAVRDAAGHANIATTSVYLHVIEEEEDGTGDLFAFRASR